jgi:hypothetical protein
MRMLAVIPAAALVAVLIAHPGKASSPAAFRTPDAGAACRLEGAAVVCSTLASPQSVRLRARGDAELVRRLPWWDASTPVRRSWHRGTVSCRLAGGALVCGNGKTAIRAAADGFAVAS